MGKLAGRVGSMRNWINAHRLWVGGFFAFWFCYFTYFWTHALFFNANGGLSVANVNMWGDWAAHFTMGSHMAYNQLIPTTSPLLIGQSFSYPFAAEFISALLIKLGIPFFNSFLVPSYICSILAVVTLYKFYEHVFESWKVSLVASTLFMLNGGLGFVYFIQDIASSPHRWQTFLNPPREYTNIEPLFYRWMSVIQSMFIPQRAWTLGFPWTLIILTLLVTLYKKQKISSLQAVIAGVMLGLLPIIHTHSFLAATIIAITWFATTLPSLPKKISSWKPWLIIGGLGASIGFIFLKLFFLNHVEHGFIRWFPGWYSHQFPQLNWFQFWWQNWGVLPIIAVWEYLLLITAAKGKQRHQVVGLWAPFFLLFILLNLFLFQPFIWDNTKILVWVSVGFSGLAAHWLYRGWHRLRHTPLVFRSIGRTVLIVLLVTMIASGTIDAYRIIRFKLHTYEMYSAEELALAQWAKQNTPSDSIWLASDQHNSWLYNLTGRQPLMAYRGWLWTHGYDYTAVETDQIKLFQFPQQNQVLFEKYGIDYIIIGPSERTVWHANESAFRKLYPVIKQTKYYLVFKRP